MANYLLAYKGGGAMPETEDERQALMAAWGGWFENLGEAVVDPGNPFGPSKAVAGDGSVRDGNDSGLTGYSVLNAGDLGAATEMAKGCPLLGNGGSVEVYETFEVM
jgi:hypothetical protein